MKVSAFLVVMLYMLMTVACSDKKSDEVRRQARESLNVENSTVPPPPPITTNPQSQPQATAVAGVQHYICPNGCEGSGGPTQVNCPVCGTQYIHNAAYHNQAASSTATTPGSANQASPPPAQNAAGVYHYTCPNGHEGGSGTAGNCTVCGTALAHNAAYHQ